MFEIARYKKNENGLSRSRFLEWLDFNFVLCVRVERGNIIFGAWILRNYTVELVVVIGVLYFIAYICIFITLYPRILSNSRGGSCFVTTDVS